MATYDELRALPGSVDGDTLRRKIEVALAIKAQTLIDGTPTTTQVEWAAATLTAPYDASGQVLNYLLAKANSFEVSQITGASDSQIQSWTDDAVDALVP